MDGNHLEDNRYISIRICIVTIISTFFLITHLTIPPALVQSSPSSTVTIVSPPLPSKSSPEEPTAGDGISTNSAMAVVMLTMTSPLPDRGYRFVLWARRGFVSDGPFSRPHSSGGREAALEGVCRE